MGKTRVVYLYHFKLPLKHAQHYLGSTNDLFMRDMAHQHGGGSRITQVAHDLGIEFEIVRTWPEGGRKLERKLKNLKSARLLCPKCREKCLARKRRLEKARRARLKRAKGKSFGPTTTSALIRNSSGSRTRAAT